MKKLIILFLLFIFTSPIYSQWWNPSINSLLKKNNTFTGKQTFDSLYANFLLANRIAIDTSFALYNLNGNRWFYANSVDSSLRVNGSNLKIGDAGKNLGMGGNNLNNNTGLRNYAYGNDALKSNTTGNYNTAINEALKFNTTGSWNTGIGEASLFNSRVGNWNTGIGTATLFQLDSGNSNVALGGFAGYYGRFYQNRLFIDGLDRFDSTRQSNRSLIIGDFNNDSSAQKLRFNAVVSVQGNILPTTTGNYNLGSEIKQFDTLFAKVVVSNIPNKIWGDSSYFETYFNSNRTSSGGMPLYYPYTNLNGIDCSLSPIYLESCNFSYANLTGATLTGAYLTGATLTNAILTSAKLIGATLTGAYLTGATLTNAILTSAKLIGANLTGANLTSATVNFEKSYIWNNCTYSATTTIWIDGNPIGTR